MIPAVYATTPRRESVAQFSRPSERAWRGSKASQSSHKYYYHDVQRYGIWEIKLDQCHPHPEG